MADEFAAQRAEIKTLLEGGLATIVHPRGDTHEMVQDIINQLQTSDSNLQTKLVIGGFTQTPVEHGGIETSCETCMYFLVHNKYCELPEFEIPVESEWSCRLWRI